MEKDYLPIRFKEPLGLPRKDEPITLGVPLPQGLFKDGELTIKDSQSQAIPTQWKPALFWPDGSVKWVIVDFLVDIGPYEETTYYLGPGTPPKFAPLILEKTREGLSVDTGIIRCSLSPERLWLGGISVAQGDLDGVCSFWRLLGTEGQPANWKKESLSVESSGPLRATVTIKGRLSCQRQDLDLGFTWRISFFAGLSLIKMEAELHNSRRAQHKGGYWDLGDPGSMFFKEFSLVVRLPGAREALIKPEPSEKEFRFLPPELELYQDSSGGDNWQSRNHINRLGKIPLRFRGYRLRGLKEEFSGLRATPIIRLLSPRAQVALGLSHFWENFPKAIVSTTEDLTLELFPHQYGDIHELQAGERKTHTFWLSFGHQGQPAPDLGWVSAPLVPVVDPSWVANSGAVLFFTPASQEVSRDYLAIVKTAIEADQSFFAKREIIDEYGWRNFGDLYADHENAFNQTGSPLISHYNNQYDVIYSGLVHFLRSGDVRWFKLADELARHVYDIDIYHTDEDKPAYNHGLFWHTFHYVDAHRSTHRCYSKDAGITGGGPSNEHLYSSGLLLHYLLTGDPRSKEAVISFADHVIDMDKPYRVLSWLDRSPSGLASQTRDPWYHGPGRGAGNSINCLLDGFLLTGRPGYLKKAEELIRRCIHPQDVPEALGLKRPEERWSYLVFLQVLGKYLFLKAEWQQLDEMFHYGRAALLHYAGWMAANEYYYLDRPELLEYPTETWAAQEIRKAEVFNLAAYFAKDQEQRNLFEERAEYFFSRSIEGLLSFKTWHYTRPLAIVLGSGFSRSWFKNSLKKAPLIPLDQDFDPGARKRFVPQKIRAKKKLKIMAGLFLVMATALGVWLAF
ncbi:RIFT barrel domain-containing protein [Thermosulfuriphilus sp.]